MKRNSMLSLTAVIPVATSIGDLSHLTATISDALQKNVQVVIVIDEVAADSNQALEELCIHFSSYGQQFQSVRGRYGSPGKARNAGKQNVKTDFVAFWDADDSIDILGVINAVSLYGDKYDYIIGSYQVVDVISGSVRSVTSMEKFGILRVIKEPGIWRMIFRSSRVNKCQFGNSFMGEDQVFLVNSGVLGSERILFTENIFYTYFTGADGQLTSKRRMNKALVESFIEIARFSVRASFLEQFYRLLVALRIGLTLVKRIVSGKK